MMGGSAMRPKTTTPFKQRALIIGVSDYPNPTLRLPNVAADVREMAKLLSSKRGTFEAQGITVLTDKDATRQAVSANLQALLKGASDSETIFVYLAGHGASTGDAYYYVPYDGDPGQLETTAVPLHDVKRLFDGCASRRLFLWLDFCHSGGITVRGGSIPDSTALTRAISAVNGSGKIIVAACSSSQFAYEHPDAGHGFFTHALLRGLKGEARSIHGDVTAPSLYEFIVRQVKHAAQQPVFFGQMEGLIVLMKSGRGSAEMNAPVRRNRPARVKQPRQQQSGPWVLLGNSFFQSSNVQHNSDGTIRLTVTPRNSSDEAALASLRPPRYGGADKLPFAVNNEAHLVRTNEVRAETSDQGQVWTLSLKVEGDDLCGTGLESSLTVDGKSYSADEIAELRARRLLLGDVPFRSPKGSNFGASTLLDAMIEGPNAKHPVKECVVRTVYQQYGDQPHWKSLARLAAVYLLKATATVRHVLQLDFGPVRAGQMAVRFRGLRASRYSNASPTAITFSGTCSIDSSR